MLSRKSTTKSRSSMCILSLFALVLALLLVQGFVESYSLRHQNPRALVKMCLRPPMPITPLVSVSSASHRLPFMAVASSSFSSSSSMNNKYFYKNKNTRNMNMNMKNKRSPSSDAAASTSIASTTTMSSAPGILSESVSTSVSAVGDDKAYDSSAITVLKGLEPVRKRPGMYIGSTGQKGLNHLVYEVIDNSVDEALAGCCTAIDVEFLADGSVRVTDNGRGIPCGIHPETGKSTLETVLCVLHAGGKFGGEESGYRVSGGLHGVGISVVNALSEALTVEVTRDGLHQTMSFSKGLPVTAINSRPALLTENRGTRVTFKPDPSIFKTTTEFDVDQIAQRLDELAYLNAGLKISLTDNRLVGFNNNISNILNTEKREFMHSGGISELVHTLCEGKTALHPVKDIITITAERKGVAVEVALKWSKDMYSEALSGFANGIRTSDGGSHLDGMKQAITKVINAFARQTGKLKEKDSSIPGEFIREGLTAIVSVKVPEPEFEGQTKTRFGNPEVRQIVDAIVSDALTTVLEWNPAIGSDICTKAIDAQHAAFAAKAARDMVRKKSLLTTSILPGKLADCSLSRDDKYDTEIFIVEGDSAAGSAKLGRDRNFQAILPLRGKILNIEKAPNEKIYQNSELQALISAIGLGIKGGDFDESALRYKKIIIMTDADVDGAHIRLLLLTFFYRYQKALLEKGFIYIACPPLFKVTTLKKGKRKEVEQYLYDQSLYDDYMSDIGRKMKIDYTGDDPISSVQVQRYKGLGEMMPQQLWDTTMDPEQRTLKQVTIDDGAAAERMFTICMGDAIDARKAFIVANSAHISMSDIDF